MGTDRHENYTISLGFSRANRGAPDTARDAVLLREQRPYSGRADSRDTNSYKEKITLPRVLRRRLRVRLRYRTLVPKDLSPCPGWGILTPFPFGRQRDKHEHVFCVSADVSLRNGFLPIPYDRLDPCQLLVTWNPSPASVLKALKLSICYYHQDLHRWRLQAGSRPAPSTHATATLLLTAA
ncbi:hypothetical protein JTE90_014859 [Oedothorax gibbosus]|uniref:Uncharacterized protein n=1 Tax=Oedothorax gibbosus TaxID=931172 RepID=A0AAV6TKL9_9ARAC|nr:hypothetical protein JTE90_014859 [Oedothorax gibbosus]